jgi:hypothetical protein
VIQRHFAGRENAMTILARIAIPHQNVLTGERSSLVGDAPVFQQPDDGRYVKGAPCWMNLGRGNFFRGRDTFQYQDECPARGADIDWFVTGVQHEDGLVKSILDCHRTRSPKTLISNLQFTPTSTEPTPRLGTAKDGAKSDSARTLS